MHVINHPTPGKAKPTPRPEKKLHHREVEKERGVLE
jgi:hypothetical protein